ncbi:S1 family peptidase [Rhodovulum sp.]|uniref:S1 family peptidase n=1 Tax=Rhodovulum sp. TaxID=34009 RepID=UPI0017C0A301|nr:serine protease [Rhodovulum sp.]HDR27411.1 serine protease [Rhodovulum sp.]
MLVAVRGLFWSILVAVWAIPAAADSFDRLWDGFDPAPLTNGERRFIQAALAFEGHYNGLLDGAWGGLSQRAMDAYSRAEYATGPRRWHVGILAFSLFDRIEREGWDMLRNEVLGLSFLFPFATSRQGGASENFSNWEHRTSSLRYSITVADRAMTLRLHEFTAAKHWSANPIYTLRKNDMLVTKSRTADGAILYTRSDLIAGYWSTVMLSSERRDQTVLDAVASSIARGRAPPLQPETGWWLKETVALSLDFMRTMDEPERPSAADPDRPPGGTEDRPDASGTGFFVTHAGDVLTNAHVVSGCRSITVNEASASLRGSSDEFDLALLRLDSPVETETAIFAREPARLNSDITVVGYPLLGLLGGLNVTRGSISAATGLMGDGVRMQISAPVQPGNSGGPVLAADGAVVGVVVSKLDALKVADAIGDIPQNVNFAIRGEIAKLFLFQNGIDPVVMPIGQALPPEELAERARQFTVKVSCAN